MRFLVIILVSLMVLVSCVKQDDFDPFNPSNPNPPGGVSRPGSLGLMGDSSDVQVNTKSGIVIMGGGADVDAAFMWMIERSGGGDAVIVRASGTDAYNSYLYKLGKLNSVETLKIDSRKLANDDGVVRIIKNAELLFIAGGDQSDYTGYWKGSKTMDAINYLLNDKKIPIGGTSAGAAILGNYYFSGERGSVTSSDALSNPYTKEITLYKDDFLKTPFLKNVITDQHFSQREREGRMTVFLARIMEDREKAPLGVAVDEATAVCIDEEGIAEVLGENKANFLKTNAGNRPEKLEANSPLTWDDEGKAVRVSSISGKIKNNRFDINTFSPVEESGWKISWWSAINGKLFMNDL